MPQPAHEAAHRPASEGAYRAEIDGLRAVAVLAILIFHLDERWLPGGFIGVDVFFVISGFLITSRILREVQAGEFSFGSFYLRRARRLLPALLATLALTWVAAWLLLIPQGLARFGRDAIAATFSAANIQYWLTLGYFDEAAGQSPLLHTWSLSVEEQFYFIWPLLMYWLGRRRALLYGLFPVICIASFGFGLVQVRSDPTGAFFLMPSRIWEFGMGAGLVLLPAVRAPSGLRAAAQALGLIGIGACAALFHPEMTFPGWLAVLPCAATAAVIWAGDTPVVARVLSNAVARWIGKVSYSIYLVHWPLIVFAKQSSLSGLSAFDLALVAGATLVLAALMYTFVEQRFRRPRSEREHPAPNRRFVIGCAASMMALAGAGFYLVRNDGLPSRYPAAFSRLLASGDRVTKEDAITWRLGKCFIGGSYGKGQGVGDFDKKTCLKLHAKKPNVLLIGDSVAAHLYSGLHAELGGELNILQVTVAGCRGDSAAKGKSVCAKLMRYALQDWLPKHAKDLDALVFATRWDRPDAFRWGESVLERVTGLGVRVVLFGAQVSFRTPPATLLGTLYGPLRTWLTDDHDPSSQLHVPRANLREGIDATDRRLAAMVARYPEARFVAPSAIQCTQGVCAVSSDEGHGPEFLYRDNVHFSPTGSRWFARQLTLDQVLAR